LADIDTSKDVVFTYETKNGPKDVSHNLISKEDYVEPTKDDIELFLKNEGFSEEEIEKFLQEKFPTKNTDEESKIDKSNICWYEIDSENNVGIFTLTECTNSDYYLASLKNFFAEVMAENISNIAVDLRGNTGGDSDVATELIKYLDEYIEMKG
jgi:C-terminal processing protease CtpA/Prc